VSPAIRLVPATVKVTSTPAASFVPALFGVKTADVRVGATVVDFAVVVGMAALVKVEFAADARCIDIPSA